MTIVKIGIQVKAPQLSRISIVWTNLQAREASVIFLDQNHEISLKQKNFSNFLKSKVLERNYIWLRKLDDLDQSYRDIYTIYMLKVFDDCLQNLFMSEIG